MEVATNKPRSPLSIITIGLILGPTFVMLWLGKGRLALLYLILTLVLDFAASAMEYYGLIDAAFMSSFPMFTLPSLALTAIFHFVGIGHGLRIRRVATGRPWFRWIAVVPAIIFCFLLFVLFPIRIFLFQPFNIPSRSGEPNLMLGDYFLVSKTAYGYSRFSFPFNFAKFEGRTSSARPQPGDIAVFKLPTNTEVDYVKRVIGLPGDRVQMISGVLYLNGTSAKMEKIQLSPEFYQDENVTYFRETLPNGRSYVISNFQDNGGADNTIEYVVPAGHYFALGDNRDNSEDSRYLDHMGYIPEDNFIGRVEILYWNSNGFSLNNRPEETYPPK